MTPCVLFLFLCSITHCLRVCRDTRIEGATGHAPSKLAAYLAAGGLCQLASQPSRSSRSRRVRYGKGLSLVMWYVEV
jgi:hypothetical protein